jgi:glycosyltransferase involved in cell wall biosynthesis
MAPPLHDAGPANASAGGEVILPRNGAGGLRVLIASDDLAAGTGVHLQSLAEPLRALGVEVSFLCYGPFQPVVGPSTRVDFGPPDRWFDRYPVAQVRRLTWLRRIVRDTRPAVVHAVFFWPIIYGRLLRAAGVVPKLVENREDQGFNWGRHEYAWLRATSAIPDRVICVSEAVRGTVLEREAIAPDRITVIRNGVALPRLGGSGRAAARAALGYGQDEVVIGLVAWLNRAVKGVRHFVEAMPEISREVPNARFLIVGGGDEEAGLRAEAQRLGVADRVRFTGFQPDVTPYYRAMDISVLTSLSEGLSITLLESMAHELPVVATRVGGNPELVVHGETGFLVPARDVAAFVAHVTRLARDPALRTAFGAAGRSRVETEFTSERVARAYALAYRTLLPGV